MHCFLNETQFPNIISIKINLKRNAPRQYQINFENMSNNDLQPVHKFESIALLRKTGLSTPRYTRSFANNTKHAFGQTNNFRYHMEDSNQY